MQPITDHPVDVIPLFAQAETTRRGSRLFNLSSRRSTRCQIRFHRFEWKEKGEKREKEERGEWIWKGDRQAGDGWLNRRMNDGRGHVKVSPGRFVGCCPLLRGVVRLAWDMQPDRMVMTWLTIARLTVKLHESFIYRSSRSGSLLRTVLYLPVIKLSREWIDGIYCTLRF